MKSEKREGLHPETIDSQNKLTPEIKKQIIEANSPILEDIYPPTNQKKDERSDAQKSP